MLKQEHIETSVFSNSTELAKAGAERFAELARTAITTHGQFSVALSGGSTPRAMYGRLAKSPLKDAIDWTRVHVFWSDERYVPLDDTDSCYLLARETLFDHVPIPANNIHPMANVNLSPEEAAWEHAKTLRTFFGSSLPRFDLILLGMGPDGHTASLFPGSPQVKATTDDLVVAVYNSPKPPPTRLSFTYRVINNAANVLLLVAGVDKAATLSEVLQGPVDQVKLPVQGIQPIDGKAIWLLDEAAARELDL